MYAKGRDWTRNTPRRYAHGSMPFFPLPPVGLSVKRLTQAALRSLSGGATAPAAPPNGASGMS
eukprot:15262120-Alexandrium_andersonii.AAC.1